MPVTETDGKHTRYSIEYAMQPRPGLTYDWNGHSDMVADGPEMSDWEVAGRVRMLMRDQLDHERICTLARDRIMGLSKLNHELLAALKLLDERGHTQATWDFALKAIAKAEGRAALSKSA